MRFRSVALVLAGSLVVHVALSCANRADHSDGPTSVADAIADILGGGDTKAEAAPPAGWTSDEVACDKTADVGTTMKWYYAEKAYPGRSSTELAHALVMTCTGAQDGTVHLPGFDCRVTTTHVRDGALGGACGYAPGKVRFLVPPPD